MTYIFEKLFLFIQAQLNLVENNKRYNELCCKDFKNFKISFFGLSPSLYLLKLSLVNFNKSKLKNKPY